MAIGNFSTPNKDPGYTVYGAATAAQRENAQEQRAASQEERAKSAESRAQEQHLLSQEKGQFELGQQKRTADLDYNMKKMRADMHQMAWERAKFKHPSEVLLDAVNMVSKLGGKMAAPMINTYFAMTGVRPDNGEEAWDTQPVVEPKTKRPGWYVTNMEGKPITVKGEPIFLPKEVTVTKPVAAGKYGDYILDKNGNWVLSGPPSAATAESRPKPPKGYEYTSPPVEGQPNEVRPIKGGPADIKAQEKAKQEETLAKTTKRKARIVVRDIDKSLALVDSAGLPAAGWTAALTQYIPGTDAYNLALTMNSLLARIGFEELQAMRAASPTGGALGQVSEMENRLLQASLGSLDTTQDPEVFKENLHQIRELYLDSWYGSEEELQNAVKRGTMTETEANTLRNQRNSVGFNEIGQPIEQPDAGAAAGGEEQPQQDLSRYVEIRELPDGRKIGKLPDGTKEWIK